MGKKSKKKGGGKKKPNHNKGLSTSAKTKPKLDSDQVSLYRIYKYCTEAVIEWGKSTFYKKKTKAGGSLSHVIFNILGSLADDGVLMPEMVLRDLKLAISYRKKVRRFYQNLPQVSQEDYARHEWLIQQLERLAKKFIQNRKVAQENDKEETTTRQGFEVLALSDDEEEDSVVSDEDEKPTARNLETPPTPEELAKEERQFATALFLYDLDTIRKNLRQRWTNWAKEADNKPENLFAVTASTEYALAAVRKSVLQMEFEIDNFSGFENIVQSMGETSSKVNQELSMKDFQEGDLVTLKGLEQRPALNGRQGFISRPMDAQTSERLAVQLFPADLDAKADDEPLSVQPKNLMLSDDTFLRLSEIHGVLGSLNVRGMDIPSSPGMTYGAPVSTDVQKAGIDLILQGSEFEQAAKRRDFQSFLKLTTKYSLPLWISLARYLPDAGAADAVLNAYIRDFASTGQLKIPFAFALLVAIDGAMVCAAEHIDLAEKTKAMVVQVSSEAYTTHNYTPAIRLLERDNKKAYALYSHFEFTKHMREEYSVAGMFFPLVSGEMMLTSLRMHFICGSGLPYTYVERFIHVLHIYWLVRSEGHLGRIPELEALVAMYQQRVFFRGGLAKKGQENFLKYQQLAQGVSAEAMRVLDGTAVARRTGRGPFNAEAITYKGLHVSEVSRLLDILQWKSMPIVDKDACMDKIESIAREEYASIFTAPLLKVSVKMYGVASALELGFPGVARQSGARMMDNFALHTSRMTPLDLVSFWAMALGDDRSIVPGEKNSMLEQFASIFQRAFGGEVEPKMAEEEPTLTFSANDHTVDSALWREKGVRRVEHLQV